MHELVTKHDDGVKHATTAPRLAYSDPVARRIKIRLNLEM